jgi:hypothetical protein
VRGEADIQDSAQLEYPHENGLGLVPSRRAASPHWCLLSRSRPIRYVYVLRFLAADTTVLGIFYLFTHMLAVTPCLDSSWLEAVTESFATRTIQTLHTLVIQFTATSFGLSSRYANSTFPYVHTPRCVPW